MRPALLSVMILCLAVGGVRSARAQDDSQLEGGQRYEVVIEGFEDAGELMSIARQSSVLMARIDDLPPSPAALRRRAVEDETLFADIAASLGYYDAVFAHRVDQPAEPGGPLRVLLFGQAGPEYVIDDIVVRTTPGGDGAAGLELPRVRLGLKVGDPARAALVVEAEANVVRLVQERSYPLATLAERVATIDRDTKTMTVLLRVDPGARARFGPVTVEGNEGIDRDYILRRLPWAYGEPADVRLLERGRKSLISTGLFNRVAVAFADKVGADGLLPVTVTVTERPRRSIGAGVSASTSEGLGTSANWTHRNLFGGAEKLAFRASYGEVESGVHGALTIPDVFANDQNFTVESGYAEHRTDGFDSISYTVGGRFDRRLSDVLSVDYGLSFERSRITDDGEERQYTLVGVPVGTTIDTSDDLLNPTKGGRTRLTFTPYLESLGSTLSFYSTYVRHAQYVSLDREGALVFAARAGFGSIFGASTGNLPADKRFYSGGSGSVRGYAFQSVGPLDAGDEPTGGSSLLEFAMELRWRVFGDFGIVPFIDGGQVYDQETPSFDEDLQWAAGLGFRYFTPIGPIRADLAFPLNPRDSDDVFQVYFSLGQAF